MKHTPIILTLLAFAATCGHATDYYWTGAVDNTYLNPTNWVINSATSTTIPTAAPRNTDYQDRIFFTSQTNPGTQTVNNGSRTIWTITCEDAGWTFTGSQLVFKLLTSSGAGTNEFTGTLKTAKANVPFTLSASNTVLCAKLDIDGENTPTFDGGGVFVSRSSIAGYSSQRKISIRNALVRIEAAALFSNSGPTATLAHKNARLQYRATPAQAAALIGTTILRGTAVLDAYQTAIRDIGGGYVEISFVPGGTLLIAK